jgi:hypothetical protein
MNSDSKFKKSSWANGQPSIDIDPYDYSKVGIDRIITQLSTSYVVESLGFTSGLDTMVSTVLIDDEKIQIHMDNWTCSLAFQSEIFRDIVFDSLGKTVK